jgi:Protein of unknown function (DUF4435)
MTLPKSAVVIANEVRLRRSQHMWSFVIIEGRNDRLFYERFFDLQQCKLVVADGKEKVCEVVRILDADNFHGVLGIVDADFDLLEEIPVSSHNIIRGNFHDIEAMLVRSPALDRVLREFGSEDKIQKLVTSAGSDIRHILSAAASPLGYLRWHSLRSNLRLRFEDLSFVRFINMTTLTADRPRLIATVKNHSQRQELQNDDLEFAIRELENSNHDRWQLCNGHDLVGVLSVGLRRALGSQSAGAVGIEELERALRLAYEAVDFAASDLCSAIWEWEQRNTRFQVLSRDMHS